MSIIIHPATFQHPEWPAIIDRLAQRTATVVEFMNTQYATLQPLQQTGNSGGHNPHTATTQQEQTK